jgi:hypothetical protein
VELPLFLPRSAEWHKPGSFLFSLVVSKNDSLTRKSATNDADCGDLPAQQKYAQNSKIEEISMNTIRRLLQVRSLLLAALVLTSFPCTAQKAGPGRAGTITFPVDTHWGMAVLPAGEYTFKVDSSGSFPLVIVRSVSGSAAALIYPDSQSMPDQAAPAGLVLEKKDGVTYVKSFYVEEVGLVFNYSMHKKKPAMMAKTAPPQPPVVNTTPAK